jgi:hypothetical protein
VEGDVLPVQMPLSADAIYGSASQQQILKLHVGEKNSFIDLTFPSRKMETEYFLFFWA